MSTAINDTDRVNRIALILRKEWLELRQERGLIIGTLLPPVFFTVLPVLLAWMVAVIPHKASPIIARAPELGPEVRVGGPGTADPIVPLQTTLQGMDTQVVEQAVIGSRSAEIVDLAGHGPGS